MLSRSHFQTHNPCWAKSSFWKPGKPPEIIEMFLSSPHPTCTLNLIPRTLVLKVLQGGGSHIRTVLGMGMGGGGEGDAEVHLLKAQLRLKILGGPLEEF